MGSVWGLSHLLFKDVCEHFVFFSLSSLVQCWVRTASLCTPPCSTHTFTWSVRMRRASPTSGSHSLWTPQAALVPANQRRPGCGIAAMESGSTFTSTAQELLLHHYSDQVFISHTDTVSDKWNKIRIRPKSLGGMCWKKEKNTLTAPIFHLHCLNVLQVKTLYQVNLEHALITQH